MYNVLITGRAEREPRRLDRSTKNRIVPDIFELAENPRPPGCLKVKGEEGFWRIRIGDWRVGYIIDDDEQEIRIIRVDHRSRFYD